MDTPGELNILGLNCWGLKVISTLHKERLREIGKQIALAQPTPHIVGLQECWTQEDYQSIREETQHILPYAKFYHSGVFGGGLAMLSKWPIEESSMVRYTLNGRPTAFWRGDWYVGKGVACARIRYGPAEKDVVEVFNTHLHAPYEREPNDSYLCHRTAQAWEMSKLVRGATERGHLAIALGDFNMLPLSLAHRLITAHAPVQDVWRVLHPDSSLGMVQDPMEKSRNLPVPTADFNLYENGATCDSVYNTWRWNKGQQKRLGMNKPDIRIPGDTPDPRAKRLDYIFASSQKQGTASWVVKAAKVGMTMRHPTLQCSLSDHFAVEATLEWQTEEDIEKIEEGHADEQAAYVSQTGLPIPVYDEILALTSEYMTRESKQRRWRLYHFVGSLVVSIGCLVAVWWSPRNFVSFLLMLLSTLGLAAGVTDGLIGGLFMSWEIRALKEFEWEMKNARRMAGGSS